MKNKDLSLSLKNPAWCARIIADAKEYKNKGTLDVYFEYNNFTSDVIRYITAHL